MVYNFYNFIFFNLADFNEKIQIRLANHFNYIIKIWPKFSIFFINLGL